MSVDPRTLATIRRTQGRSTQNARLARYECGCSLATPIKPRLPDRLCQYHEGYDDALDEHSAPFAGLTDQQRAVIRKGSRMVLDHCQRRVGYLEFPPSLAKVHAEAEVARELLGMLQ